MGEGILGGQISNAAIKSPSIKGNKCEKEVVTNKVLSGGGKNKVYEITVSWNYSKHHKMCV